MTHDLSPSVLFLLCGFAVLCICMIVAGCIGSADRWE